jgi:hypothetical protein
LRSAATKDRFPEGKTLAPAPSTNGCNGHAGATAGRAVALPPPATVAPPATQALPAAEGRDAHGRFTAGNRGGPGNPFARAVGTRRRALLDAVSPEDLARVAKKLLEMAKCGDLPAAALLFKYVVGQPRPAPDPDALDVAEYELLRRSPTLAEFHEALDRIAAGFAATMALAGQPADREGYEALVAKNLKQVQAELRRLKERFPLSYELDDDDDLDDDPADED